MATGGTYDESLSCAVCLGPFQDPKFLPCFHTFCSSCILDVASRHLGGTFPCPACRKSASLPAGGVNALQTNFYIPSASSQAPPSASAIPSAKPQAPQAPPSATAPDGEFCKTHGKDKRLEFYCVKCDRALCLNCKLTQHERHPTEDLSAFVSRKMKQLTKDRRRLETAVADMLQQAKKIEMVQQAQQGKKAAVERNIQERYATVMAAADKWRNEALVSLESIQMEISSTTNQILKQKKEGVKELEKIKNQLDQAVMTGTTQDIIAVAKETSSGRGNKQRVSKMSSGVQLSTIRPVLHFNVTTEDMMQKLGGYLGTVTKMHMEAAPSNVRIAEVLRSSSKADTDTVIYSLCPTANNTVVVSFAQCGLTGDHPCHEYDLQGQLVSIHQNASGKVSWKYRGKGKTMLSAPSTPGWIRTYNKSQKPTCFRLDNDLSGKADIKRVTITFENPLETRTTTEFSIKVGPHRAFDVDDSEQIFVVLEEGQSPDFQRKVRLYRKRSKNASFTYTPPGLPFQPTDVAFYKQILMIADEGSDSIHMVNVQGEQLSFLRYLAAGCPLLVQPTALNTDAEGRLWVACRGGGVITMQY